MFKRKINKTLALFISLLILLSGSIAVLSSSLTEVHASAAQVLGVSISPSGGVSLSVGQVQVFTASCSNVSFAPFSYEWSANGSVLGTGQTLSFSFSAACSGELLVLRVTGKDGSLGCATEWISDPTVLPAIYLPLGAIASTDGLGWYYYTFNGQLMDQSTNAAQIINEALGNYSSVTVQNGAWNVNLGTLPANVIIKIDGGVTGLTYIPSAGDYVIDESSGDLWWNGVNDTYLLSNPYSSLITNATIIALIASSTLNWAQISNANVTADQLIMSALASVTNLTSSQISDFNSAVSNLLSYASISTSQITSFNSAVNSLIAAASIAWSQVTNANETVVQLVTNSAITWSQITNANLTVQQLVGIYQNFNWQGSWNATVQQIIGNAAIAWNQVTGANATVNALISEASLSWSQISDANTNVNSLISTYMSTLSSLSVSGTITAGNVVSTEPMGAYSYMIYIDPVTHKYDAKAANGTICWTSTNPSLVLNWTIGNLTIGRTEQQTIILSGNLGQISNVLMANYTNLEGENGAIITLASGQTNIFEQGNANLANVTISNIAFVAQSQVSSSALYFFHLNLNSVGWWRAGFIKIDSCSFTGFSSAIFTIMDDSILSNSIFINNYFSFESVAGTNDVAYGNLFEVPKNGIGYQVYDASVFSIYGNRFANYQYPSIATAAIQLVNAARCTISGNVFSCFVGASILMNPHIGSTSTPIDSITITSNSFSDAYNAPTGGVIDCGRTTFDTNIVISSNTVTGLINSFLYVGTYGANITLSANTLSGTATGYVYNLNGALYNVNAYGNVIYNMGGTNIFGTGYFDDHTTINAELYNTANQNVPDTTLTTINFTSIVTNTGCYNATILPTQLTATQNGLYLITTNLFWSSVNATDWYVYIFENGNTAVACTIGDGVYTVTAVVRLNAGDYVQVKAQQFSGVSQTILGSVDIGFISPTFTITKIAD